MKKGILLAVSLFILVLMASPGYSAYNHPGEADSPNFLAVYPEKAGTKLDSCALCHTGGQYENNKGQLVSMGSCQWCHYSSIR